LAAAEDPGCGDDSPCCPSNIIGRKDSYSLKITGSDWVDTGVVLSAGDHVDWSATGTLQISDGREATPDGLAHGWKDLIRQFPMVFLREGVVMGFGVC
jgi:hypothetical protein